ncbi:MAG: hypothetical protein ABIH25_00725 [Candidatus Woesearchaeota archaeon]
MKRGQAAMEFLMSYGWAILVVLVAISALAYFGVLDPNNSLPETCILFPGLGCDDYKVDSNGVTLVITNGLGKDLESFSITVLGDGACGEDSSQTVNLNDGGRVILNIDCIEKPTPGMRFVRELQVNYNEIGGLDHNRLGDLSTMVED